MSELTLSQLCAPGRLTSWGRSGLVSGAVSAAWGQYFSLEPLQPLAPVSCSTPAPCRSASSSGLPWGSAWPCDAQAVGGDPVLITTMYAWSAAVHTAVRLQRNSGDDPYLIAASLCAGALGAALTQLGCSLFARELRRPGRILLTAPSAPPRGCCFSSASASSSTSGCSMSSGSPRSHFALASACGKMPPLPAEPLRVRLRASTGSWAVINLGSRRGLSYLRSTATVMPEPLVRTMNGRRCAARGWERRRPLSRNAACPDRSSCG